MKKAIIISASVVAAVGILLIGFSIFAYNTDVSRLKGGEEPLFVYHDNGVNDGGTLIYRGLGYKVIKWHRQFDNTALEREDFGELAGLGDSNSIYVCGWDICRGGLDELQGDPDPNRTIDFHFEQV